MDEIGCHFLPRHITFLNNISHFSSIISYSRQPTAGNCWRATVIKFQYCKVDSHGDIENLSSFYTLKFVRLTRIYFKRKKPRDQNMWLFYCIKHFKQMATSFTSANILSHFICLDRDGLKSLKYKRDSRLHNVQCF